MHNADIATQYYRLSQIAFIFQQINFMYIHDTELQLK